MTTTTVLGHAERAGMYPGDSVAASVTQLVSGRLELQCLRISAPIEHLGQTETTERLERFRGDSLHELEVMAAMSVVLCGSMLQVARDAIYQAEDSG